MVDNTPVVPQEKVEKLTNVMKRLFGGVGTIREGMMRNAKIIQTRI